MSGPEFRFNRHHSVRPRGLRKSPVPIRRKPRSDYWLVPVMAMAFCATIAVLQRTPDVSSAPDARPGAIPLLASAPTGPRDTLSARFGLCHTGGGRDCVVDGDTFWFAGEKYRIADIDTPETHPARCAEEAALGNAATERLRVWLNAGTFSLESVDRDTDQYGRKLRIVTRGGASVGDALVAEGLARRWEGYRRPWC